MRKTVPNLPGFDEGFISDLGVKAGTIMNKFFKPSGINGHIKAVMTPVTIAGKEISSMVVETIRKHWLDISIQGEGEGELTNSNWKVVFNPIDGTLAFEWGIPISTFSLALLYDGTPIRSVIYDPYLRLMYTAEAGKGSFVNGEKILVYREVDTTTKPVVSIVSWPGCEYKMLRIAQILEEMDFLISSVHSLSYMAAQVAVGNFAAAIFPGDGAHYSAAGHLLVHEAGGKATNILGEKQSYRDRHLVKGHFFSDELTHKKILEVVLAVQKPLQTKNRK